MDSQSLRIIDANCNRVSEGLRFLEDTARFILNNQKLSLESRHIRHAITKITRSLGYTLLSQRDIPGDVGSEFIPSHNIQDMPSLIIANAKRIEEGLRVLEEIAKLSTLSDVIKSTDFQRMRFSVYRIEKELTGKIVRKVTSSRIKGLYAIIDIALIGSRTLDETASGLIRGGTKIIQLRDKTSSKSNVLRSAQQLQQICRKSEVMFIINDHIDIALAVSADGIQIGKDDMPLEAARRILPINMIIGYSAYSIKEALYAQELGADYIGIGAVFATDTKGDAPVIDLNILQKTRDAVSIPLVAIGGITGDNIQSVMETGTDAAAVVSALMCCSDIEEASRGLIAKIS